jgi:hypothetical protein
MFAWMHTKDTSYEYNMVFQNTAIIWRDGDKQDVVRSAPLGASSHGTIQFLWKKNVQTVCVQTLNGMGKPSFSQTTI